MKKTLLTLMNNIKNSSDKTEWNHNNRALLLETNNHPREFQLLVKTIMISTIRNSINTHLNTTNNKIEIDTKSYQDSDNQTRCAIFIAVLQNHELPTDEIEIAILNDIYKYIQKTKLQGVINDVCVNDWQWRNNKIKKVEWDELLELGNEK